MTHIAKKGFILLSCLLGLCACQEDVWESRSEGSVKILARMDDGLKTRTCVDSNSPDGITGILWSPGDSIGVYGSSGTRNALFTSLNATNAAEAVFSGSLGSSESPVYAYFPYSAANASAGTNAIGGNLKLEQTYSSAGGKLESDYKVGIPEAHPSDGQYEFTFEHLFSLLRFDVDASGTALAGDRLERIVLTAPDGRRLGGEFTFDAGTKAVTWTDASAEGRNRLTMTWSDKPTLGNNLCTGYMTCAPDIEQGDQLMITILTESYKAEFTATSQVAFAANMCYTFPLTLSNYDNVTVTPRPAITSFAFDATTNVGKILDTKLVYANSTTSPVSNTSETLTIDATSISGCIPYLYDFTLVPTFSVTEGMTVTVNGVVQVSGESAQDFTQPVTYTVSDGIESRDYTVTVTNTGLPIVVLTQDGVGNTSWEEAGLTVRSKDSDWATTDKITVYNADGTLNNADRLNEAACGFRLRGNSTQNFPKLPFAIKLDKKAEMLGMAAHKRWVLLANWMDRTMLRNAVAFEVANQIAVSYPADGLGWNPTGQNVELVINGRHVGNYYLCEQIKIDENRVAIQEAYEDVASPTIGTCGYLIELDDAMDENCKDRTDRGIPWQLKDDVPWEDSSEFKTYLTDKINNIEAYLEAGNYTAAYELLDINSVIDYFFSQELTMNDEYKHPKSVYMYIDGEGQLTAGPVWDFDWQSFSDPAQISRLGAIQGYVGRNLSEWLYSASALAGTSNWPWSSPNYDNDQPYVWYPLLMKDANFRTRVQERWQVIYPNLVSVTAKIEKLAEENRLSDSYNQAMWPQLNEKRNASYSVAYNGDEDLSFDAAVDLMKDVYQRRLDWMNTAITTGNFVTDAE